MAQDVKLIEILQYAPKDKLKLYSVLHGKDVIFKGIQDAKSETDIVAQVDGDKILIGIDLIGIDDGVHSLHSSGNWFFNGECIIFPDRTHRSWNKWQYWLFRWSIGSVIIDQYNNPYLITEEYYYPENPKITDEIIRNHKMDLTDARYATPQETHDFFKELEKNEYYFDEKTGKVLRINFSLVPDKYYICTKAVFIPVDNGCGVTKRVFKEGFPYKATSKNTMINNQGGVEVITNELFKNHFRETPWSMADAKRGDTLVDSFGVPFIFDRQDENGIYAFCGLSRKSKQFVFRYNKADTTGVDPWISKIGNFELNLDAFQPASYTEKQTLYLAMKEAGYSYDKDYSMLVGPRQKKEKRNRYFKPTVGMLLRTDPKKYSDPFQIYNKEEYLSRVYIIVDINDMGEATLAPITTRTVVTLGFYKIENLCPIHEKVKDLVNLYIEVPADEKIVYDPHFLEILDPVLVKNLNIEEWKLTHFSHINKDGKFVCETGVFNICIPLNKLTKHLVGTTQQPIPIYDMKIE